MLRVLVSTFFSLVLVSIFSGCDKKSKTAVSEVHWDRDMCTRCVMVVSDRKNSVQVRHPDSGKVYMFDDIGCMALWFDEEQVSWKDGAVVWITDVNSGEWLDARKAHYTSGNVTPMAFGFSAHKTKESVKKEQEVIDFNEVLKRVTKRDN